MSGEETSVRADVAREFGRGRGEGRVTVSSPTVPQRVAGQPPAGQLDGSDSVEAIRSDLGRLRESLQEAFRAIDEDSYAARLEAREELGFVASFEDAVAKFTHGNTIDLRRVGNNYGYDAEEAASEVSAGLEYVPRSQRDRSSYADHVARVQPLVDRLRDVGVDVQTGFRELAVGEIGDGEVIQERMRHLERGIGQFARPASSQERDRPEVENQGSVAGRGGATVENGVGGGESVGQPAVRVSERAWIYNHDTRQFGPYLPSELVSKVPSPEELSLHTTLGQTIVHRATDAALTVIEDGRVTRWGEDEVLEVDSQKYRRSAFYRDLTLAESLEVIAARETPGPAPPFESRASVGTRDVVNEIERGPDRVRSSPAPTETIVLDDAMRACLAGLREHDRLLVQNAAAGNEGSTSERFITDLDRRLGQSELEERGWKGREDLNDVMRDLRRLAESDVQRASDLWSKYRPDDKDRPAFLDSDELAETRARRADAGTRGTESEKPEFVPPAAIRKLFIQAGDRYYFRHGENRDQLAIEDRGNRLVTRHDDLALSVVQLAEAKGWQSLNIVKGTDEFRQKTWLEGSLRGMEVSGYKPRDVDLQRLAELKTELGVASPSQRRNVVENVVDNAGPDAGRAHASEAAPARRATPEIVDSGAAVDEPLESLTSRQRVVLDTVKAVWRQQGASDREIELAAAATVERFQNQRVYVGRITEHGEARFEHNPHKKMSYYVKLDTREEPIWGVDLPRALKEGNITEETIKRGDEVVIANQGWKEVVVTEEEKDASGKVIGTVQKVANRNTWQIDTLQSLREDARDQLKARAAQADRAPLVQVHDRNAERAEPRPDVAVERTPDRERIR